MRKKTKERFASTIEIIGLHVEKYRIMMIVLSSIIAAIALFFSIYWNFDENSGGTLMDDAYLISYIVFAVLSVLMIILLVLNKFKIIKTKPLAIIIHSYVFVLIVWATLVCLLDLNLGISPFIYLIISTMLAGLFIVEPIFYTVLMVLSFSAIMIMQAIYKFPFFTNDFLIENIVNLFIFVLIAILTSFRHFRVTVSEYRAKARLEQLTYEDELTGLLNERSYVNDVDQINDDIQKGKCKDFAIILMDVNNLKATNDAYGHRYGCHLVVRTGHTLPTVLKTSKLYHVGGDEFIAIVMGDDLVNFEETMKLFDETFLYSLITYEGKELIFSVARGYSIHQNDERFQDTLQRADEAMYKNKAELKAKYNMKGR